MRDYENEGIRDEETKGRRSINSLFFSPRKNGIFVSLQLERKEAKVQDCE